MDTTKKPEIIGIEYLLKMTAILGATANTILIQNAHILAYLGNANPDEVTRNWFNLRDQNIEERFQSLKADISKDLMTDESSAQ